ncbi:ATP-binding protein [Ideonella sp. YS5]|uniref:hybrid sensor histidine kinase/response regulator n=1 Tax=Ideonella sp. YS5 TaxID=3453714 RepID=UPI003EEB23C2
MTLDADTTGSGSVTRDPRLPAFYRALSEMGQTMVRATEPGLLYDGLCRIAVQCCGASMAWIGLVEAGVVRPMAWAGGAERYTEGLNLAVARPQDADAELGPTAHALRSGRPLICNDFQADARTVPYREHAARFGVGSSGAFPIRRAGQTVGTLNLYFGSKGAFDPALVELIGQLVQDLCFSLEHIDREAGRALAERSAGEREAQLAGIVGTAMDAIIAVDAHFKVVLFNHAAERMFGVPAQEAIGLTLDRFIPPEYRAAHPAHMSRYAAEGVTTRRMGASRELTGLRANGERFPIEASISRAGEGERVLMTVMARDVTQLRQAEKAQLARTAAEAANRAKTEFLSRISHELRTPMNAVLGFTQLLRAEGGATLNGRQREQLDLVLQAGEHLCMLIDEMLDISRIEAGRMSVDHRDFELCELLDGVMRMSQLQAQECQVVLHAGYSPQCRLLMRTDPSRLRQVLLNLLSNAIKYNRPGGWVRLEVERDPYFVHILVRDNGLGMSQEQRSQLFQPFNRLGREGSGVQGTGIGLVLVRQLVGLLGGEVSLESEHERGTLVRVTLPAGDGRPMASARHADAQAPSVPPIGVVLYVEDNPLNVILVEQLLSRWPGVQLVTAADGGAGLERARTLQPDLVLLDMQLPDMSGLDVLRQLKADPATRAITVVALSASAVPQDVSEARASGALDYWTKPIDFDAFLQGTARLLERPARGDQTSL